jgi:hypothetical protein
VRFAGRSRRHSVSPGALSRIVIYRDSVGMWDGLMTVDNKFAGFKLLGAKTPERALLLARKRDPIIPLT